MFIPPQLCTRAAGRSWLAAPGYVAEPKLDGQRIQLHIAGHRTVAAFSRPGRDLLSYPGLAWLRTLCWSVADAILDGELCAALGIEGFRAVKVERARPTGETMVTVFDGLAAEGQALMPARWSER